METIIGSPRIESFSKNDFMEVIEFLGGQTSGVVIFDSDYTIRKPGKGVLGEISSEVMEKLKDLRDSGWGLIFVSNQPKKGHQIAREISKRRGGYFFPDSLEKEFGTENVFGGGTDFPIRHFKRTAGAVEMVADRVKKVLGNKLKIWMVGDRQADEEFFNKVMKDLQGPTLKVEAGFIRLPDSGVVKMVKKAPKLVRGRVVDLVERVMP